VVWARPDVSRCRTRTVVGVDAEAGCRDIETAKSPAELMVGGLSAGGRWIRTISPCREGCRAILRKVNSGDRRGSQKNLRGTDGSNPSPSSGESGANSTPRLRRPASCEPRARTADSRFGTRKTITLRNEAERLVAVHTPETCRYPKCHGRARVLPFGCQPQEFSFHRVDLGEICCDLVIAAALPEAPRFPVRQASQFGGSSALAISGHHPSDCEPILAQLIQAPRVVLRAVLLR
jgi:hypothetical protein